VRQWQYKVVKQRVLVGLGGPEPEEDPERTALLERYGRDGWELVSVVVQSYRREYDPTALYGYSFLSYFLKREVR
jgi:hypothetical protein